MEFGSYDYALHFRRNWQNPEGVGEVTYTGNYCVVTGSPGSGSDPYGIAIPGNGKYVTMMYAVGFGSVMESTCFAVATAYSNLPEDALANHDAFIDQAEAMDDLEFVYG